MGDRFIPWNCLIIIGLPELSAKEAEDYIRIASELAHDREKLTGFWKRSWRSDRGLCLSLPGTAIMIHQLLFNNSSSIVSSVSRSIFFRSPLPISWPSLCRHCAACEHGFPFDSCAPAGNKQKQVLFVNRPLRIGYLPADFCRHTVGLFVKDVLSAYDTGWISVYAPPGMEAQFVEPIIRLPNGRFCYQPVPRAQADIAPLSLSWYWTTLK